MIKRVFAKGFKGLDFDQALEPYTVITGRVGSGKSARALALILLVTGGLPGIARTNGDVFRAVCGGDELTVGIETSSGKVLERSFRRGKKGSIGGSFRVDGEGTPKHLFEVALEKEGIAVADVASFLALSDAKKIDELFRLFPPAGNVLGLKAAISKSKERIAQLEADIRAKEESCKSLAVGIADLKLPAGNLPEVQTEIVRLEREYQEARDELVRERMRQAQRAKAPAQETLLEAPKEAAPARGPLNTEQPRQAPAHATPPAASNQAGISALQRVMAALEGAGCGACAARLILRRELRSLEACNG